MEDWNGMCGLFRGWTGWTDQGELFTFVEAHRLSLVRWKTEFLSYV